MIRHSRNVADDDNVSDKLRRWKDLLRPVRRARALREALLGSPSIPLDWAERRLFCVSVREERGWCEAHTDLVRGDDRLDFRKFARAATIDAELEWREPEHPGVVEFSDEELAELERSSLNDAPPPAWHQCPLCLLSDDRIARLVSLARY